MNIIYLGTPDFAVKPLVRLIEAGHNVIAVITQPDRPKGRKMVMTPPPVKVYAESQGLVVFQFEKIRKEGVDLLRGLSPDIMVTAAYGQILSQEIIDIPKYGILNIHASLLPKYRGASPIQAALMNGESVTGVTIMQTDIGIDTGDIILSDCLGIEAGDNTATLTEKLSELGARLIVEALAMIEAGNYSPTPQDCASTHCSVIRKKDTIINWDDESACVVHNKVRAFSPAMGGLTEYEGESFKIRSTATSPDNFNISTNEAVCGTVVISGKRMFVVCKDSVIEVLTLQPAGKKIMSAEEYIRGNNIDTGSVLG